MLTRDLAGVPAARVHAAFVAAFSDYLIPMKPLLPDFEETLRRRGYDPTLSFGTFADDEEIVAFTLNGVGEWQGAPAAYDSGTGVVPRERRKGLAARVMEASIEACRARRIDRYVLEVIRENSPARELYRRLGFTETRELRCFVIDDSEPAATPAAVKDSDDRILPLVRAWSDVRPSWQNDSASVLRSTSSRMRLAIEEQGEIVAAMVVYPSGDVPLLAVNPANRGRGLATALLHHASERVGRPLRFINVDAGATETIAFLERRGARELIVQQEMVLRL